VSVASAHVDPDWARLRAHVRAMLGRRLANGADAEDVVQEVLLRVFRGTNNLRDGDRFGSWLATMVRNAVTGDGADIAEREPDESDDAARKSLITVLRPFVARLPAIYRDVITLSELDDVPHAEIARRLSISVSGVKSRVQRGREQLHKMLTDCCQIALDARGGVVDCVPRAETAAAGCCAPGDGTPASKPADAAS
jgi:RNA polymerase sigma-70 factor (ECF subfamily)